MALKFQFAFEDKFGLYARLRSFFKSPITCTTDVLVVR